MSVADYPDYDEQSGSAVVLASTDLTATGLAKETGGNLASAASSTLDSSKSLNGSQASALVSAAGLHIASDMLHANTGVTTELAALLASGTPGGSPGGVPLLVYGNQLDQQSSVAVNTTVKIFPSATTYYSISQIGYDGYITVGASSGPTYVRVILDWFQGTTLIDSQSWWIVAGVQSGTQHEVYIKGPTRGNQLQVTFETASGSALVGFTLLQNSRVYPRDQWLTSAWAVEGGTAAAADPGNGVLASQATGSIGAGASSASYILPLWAGRAFVTLQIASGSSAGQVTITNPADVALSSSSTVAAFSFPASSDTMQEVILPRANCSLIVHNAGSTAESPTFAVIADL